MKVLIEASEAYRNRGGIGRFSNELIAHLPATVDVVISPQDYATRIHHPTSRNRTRRLKYFADHLWLSQVQAAYVARQQRPDVLHALSFFSPLVRLGVPK